MEEDKNKKIDNDLDTILDDLRDDRKKISDASNSNISGSEKIEDLQKALEETQKKLDKALELLGSRQASIDPAKLKISKEAGDADGSQRIIEGVFNGESMVGDDGKRYNIPANYASKSKLVEGDILKLTITGQGSFIYKQIGPIDRKQLISKLGFDENTGDWYAIQDNKQWKLLTASVTYFKGEPGDEVVIIIPKNSHSSWAAVENVIKN